MRALLKLSPICILIAFATAVSFPSRALGDSFTFSTLPVSGNVSGSAGATVGWGYSITNQSSSDWLVTTNLTADSFLNGTPTLLFDFPFIAPGQTAAESFNPAASSGLYEVTWDSSAPAGFVNVGNFALSAQWWTGNPIGDGVFIADAPDVNTSYSASVGPATAVPEPPGLVLILSATMLLIQSAALRSLKGSQPE